MAKIIRGTTPVIEYVFKDVSLSDIAVAILTVKQDNVIKIEKPLQDAIVGESIAWRLTQQETLQLKSRVDAILVCDWKLTNGVRGRSKILSVDVEDPGKDEVI